MKNKIPSGIRSVDKKVFDKICHDANKSEEEVLEKFNTVGCVFVDF